MRGDDGPLLGAGGVLVVAACVIHAFTGSDDLAGFERLLDQPRVVGCTDDLDASAPVRAAQYRTYSRTLGLRNPPRPAQARFRPSLPVASSTVGACVGARVLSKADAQHPG